MLTLFDLMLQRAETNLLMSIEFLVEMPVLKGFLGQLQTQDLLVILETLQVCRQEGQVVRQIRQIF